MPDRPRLSTVHLLLIEEPGASRALTFTGHDTASLIAAALAAAAGLPAPSGTGPAAAVGGASLRLSLWAIAIAGTPRLAVAGSTSLGPLLLLARTELEALAIRTALAVRHWSPRVLPLESGATADLSRHEPDAFPDFGAPRHVAPLAGELCPRCADHYLHEDPVFDDRSRLDGSRICNACGNLEALRLERYARLGGRGEPA